MVVSTRTGQPSETTKALLKRLGLGKPLTPLERKRIMEDREEFKRALRSAGGPSCHCYCCCCRC